MALDVLGLGFCCMDDLLQLTEIPPPEGRATIVRRDRQGGGMVATAMVAAARLGVRAGFISAVGDDETGRQIREEFERYGVNVSCMVVRPGARSHLTVVLVDGGTGARAFLSQRGDVAEVEANELDREYVTSARILHLSDTSNAALQAARWAKAAGSEVCYDGTHFHPGIFTLAPLLDYLVVSRFFASEFVAHQEGRDVGRFARDFAGGPAAGGTVTSASEQRSVPSGADPSLRSGRQPSPILKAARFGAPEGMPVPEPPVHHGAFDVEPLRGEQLLAAARRVRALGPPVVVVTEGEQGSWCIEPDGEQHVPAFPVAAVDTTGAGDVFHGAFLAGRVQGWDLRAALWFASATAALKCRALGGRTGIPTMDEALALAESQRR